MPFDPPMPHPSRGEWAAMEQDRLWREQQAEQARWWASLTPAQRAAHERAAAERERAARAARERAAREREIAEERAARARAEEARKAQQAHDARVIRNAERYSPEVQQNARRQRERAFNRSQRRLPPRVRSRSFAKEQWVAMSMIAIVATWALTGDDIGSDAAVVARVCVIVLWPGVFFLTWELFRRHVAARRTRQLAAARSYTARIGCGSEPCADCEIARLPDRPRWV